MKKMRLCSIGLAIVCALTACTSQGTAVNGGKTASQGQTAAAAEAQDSIAQDSSAVPAGTKETAVQEQTAAAEKAQDSAAQGQTAAAAGTQESAVQDTTS